ncbi:MAG: SPASM domain-containing protein, partial [Thermodesulfobacteriota bacterium]
CATGEVFPCPLIDFSLGCFTKTPFERLIRSSKAGRFRRTIGTHQLCQTCTEPGLERYALPFEGFTYGHLMTRMKKRGFEEFHAHMGLDKHLD